MANLPNGNNHTNNHLVYKVSFLMILLIVAAAFYTCYRTYRDLNELTLSRRQSIAYLTAAMMKERIDKIVDIGTSLTSRVQFRNHIAGGRWEDAIKIMESVPRDFSFIDRVSIYDTRGILKASTPITPDIAAVLERDFSYRDYYRGVSKDWKPYVAEIIKPAVPLGYNVLPVAIPIKSDSSQVLGFMLISVKLDTITAWVRGIDVGPAGFVYIVDNRGHLVVHPTILPAEDIVDFSSVPTVQKVLRGERGVEVTFNPIENEDRVAAYEPMEQYGWGVVVVQPRRTAFVERDMGLLRMIFVWVAVILAVILSTLKILSNRRLIRVQRDKEKIILDSIGDGLIAIDRYWNITLWNKVASSMTGWTKEEVMGKPFRNFVKFVKEKDKTENIGFIERAMLTGTPQNMENHTLLIQKGGKEIYVGDSASPIFDESGMVEGAIIIFRDISIMEGVEKVKEEFVFRVIHDLRSPSTAIKVLAEEYDRPEELVENQDKLKKFIELVKIANRSMLELINKLLESAKGGVLNIIKSSRAELRSILTEVMKQISPLLSQKGIKIDLDIQENLPDVAGDTGQVKEIFINLIDNAIKYGRENGSIKISATTDYDIVKVSVRDDGIGIAPENLSKLFSSFYRVDSGTSVYGTGLGLYITKKMVEDMKGRIEVASKVGEGTTFTIYLPVFTK